MMVVCGCAAVDRKMPHRCPFGRAVSGVIPRDGDYTNGWITSVYRTVRPKPYRSAPGTVNGHWRASQYQSGPAGVSC